MAFVQPFIKNGYVAILTRHTTEPKEYFLERGNFIVSQQPKTKEEYEEAINYSRIMVNVKYHGSEYNKEVMTKLKEMMDRSYVK